MEKKTIEQRVEELEKNLETFSKAIIKLIGDNQVIIDYLLEGGKDEKKQEGNRNRKKRQVGKEA